LGEVAVVDGEDPDRFLKVAARHRDLSVRNPKKSIRNPDLHDRNLRDASGCIVGTSAADRSVASACGNDA
jgi:hypothetical protein